MAKNGNPMPSDTSGWGRSAESAIFVSFQGALDWSFVVPLYAVFRERDLWGISAVAIRSQMRISASKASPCQKKWLLIISREKSAFWSDKISSQFQLWLRFPSKNDHKSREL
jgi:hypothetical protein